jgi:alkanesulfonate monooxygenase SsuD/methylene tetrahydromethanopterin reductase-like flavin-dependent oxidoreductase (luciferase family)
VSVDAEAGERVPPTDVVPVAGDPEELAAHLRGLAEAGADEAILVLDPITEKSVRTVAGALALLDGQ